MEEENKHIISKKANLSDSLEDIGIGFHSSQDSYGHLYGH